MSDTPSVLLLRMNELPTKSEFETSNFDDWVNGRYISTLVYQVPGLWRSDRFDGLEQDQPPKNSDAVSADCSGLPSLGSTSACSSTDFKSCQNDCSLCMVCVRGEGDVSSSFRCSDVCDSCTSSRCTNLLAACAGPEDECHSETAAQCEQKCGGCMACFDSSDRMCQRCGCCVETACLPLHAKCTNMGKDGGERSVYVGVYNHPRFYNDKSVLQGKISFQLMEDPSFARKALPTDWLSELYDPFHDIRSLEATQRRVYPSGEQFMYLMDLTEAANRMAAQQMRIYRDRMTLIQIQNPVDTANTVLAFSSAVNITHVLSSSKAAPKTWFDFDQMH